MNANEIIKAINEHEELSAQINERGEIEISKVDDASIGNELTADYIERIAGRELSKMISLVNSDEAASVATFTLA